MHVMIHIEGTALTPNNTDGLESSINIDSRVKINSSTEPNSTYHRN